MTREQWRNNNKSEEHLTRGKRLKNKNNLILPQQSSATCQCQFISSQTGLGAPMDNFPSCFLCFRLFTSVLTKSLNLSKSTLCSTLHSMSTFCQIPAAVTELSIGTWRGWWRCTIFCTRLSGLGYMAFGQTKQMANHHLRARGQMCQFRTLLKWGNYGKHTLPSGSVRSGYESYVVKAPLGRVNLEHNTIRNHRKLKSK